MIATEDRRRGVTVRSVARPETRDDGTPVKKGLGPFARTGVSKSARNDGTRMHHRITVPSQRPRIAVASPAFAFLCIFFSARHRYTAKRPGFPGALRRNPFPSPSHLRPRVTAHAVVVRRAARAEHDARTDAMACAVYSTRVIASTTVETETRPPSSSSRRNREHLPQWKYFTPPGKISLGIFYPWENIRPIKFH